MSPRHRQTPLRYTRLRRSPMPIESACMLDSSCCVTVHARTVCWMRAWPHECSVTACVGIVGRPQPGVPPASFRHSTSEQRLAAHQGWRRRACETARGPGPGAAAPRRSGSRSRSAPAPTPTPCARPAPTRPLLTGLPASSDMACTHGITPVMLRIVCRVATQPLPPPNRDLEVGDEHASSDDT